VLWWFQGNERLPPGVRASIDRSDTDVFVSAVSAYEVALKHRLGKLPDGADLARNFERMVVGELFEPLPLTLQHALAAGDLPIAHRDPFDRMLIAQAIVEDLTLVSNETIFDASGVSRFW
jgi:PIN domain nuclease of toxin-antitoxin system